MKTCPACQTQYTDDTLRYCLQDGSTLEGRQASVPTVVLGEAETFVDPRSAGSARTTRKDLGGPDEGTPAVPRKGSTPQIVMAAILTAMGMLLAFGVLGLGAYLYLRERPSNSNDGKEVLLGNNVEDRNYGLRSPVPAASPAVSVLPTPATSPTPQMSDRSTGPVSARVREEVLATIDEWRMSTESMNTAALAGHYARTVDYHNRRGANSDFVISDKNRAFDQFSSMRIRPCNFSIGGGSSEDRVSVTFDKEWTFTGRRTSTGKVRQLLEMEKIGGRWLITAERDVKVY